MKQIFATLGVVILLMTVVLGILGLWGVQQWHRAGPLPADKIVEIDRGDGVAKIAHTLAAQQVIDYPLLFVAGTRALSRQADLKAGEYQFPARVTMADVLDKMARGDIFTRRFTIPEGFTSWQAVQVIGRMPGLTGDLPPVPAEGTLLPQTYQFLKGDSRTAALQQAQDAMKSTLAELWAARAPDNLMQTPQQAVILASIVEKETGVARERPRIAGLFLNRLRANMPLQSDPTVIYALTKGEIQMGGLGPLGRHLLAKDLEADSPYNTYKYAGLPPGPIANPGRDALFAVLHPEQNDFLYFVADGSGGHVFARTLTEHNINVARWRAIRKETNP